MRGPGLLLIAQVGDIGGKARRFGVAFGVAGGVDVKLRLLLPDKGCQVAGVDEIGAFGPQRGAVAAQCQHVGHAGRLELIEQGFGRRFVAAHAEDVGQRFDAELLL